MKNTLQDVTITISINSHEMIATDVPLKNASFYHPVAAYNQTSGLPMLIGNSWPNTSEPNKVRIQLYNPTDQRYDDVRCQVFFVNDFIG